MTRLAFPQDRWRDSERLDWMRDVARRAVTGSFTWNPPNVGANTTVDTTLTTTDAEAVSGLRAGMPVYVSPPSDLDAGLLVGAAWVPDDDELTIRLRNVTGSAINQASGTWAFFGFMT